ncbi:hypothetical protein HBA54_15885 [Pelagibius litoralis]|uniref:Restriction endonuclease BamHI n=1 Tax=Pelagibius litoralis TaxID=374515 RepID=A0A967EZ51_9PROT|nr:hypothetical protein [Pelagibius litoralis]NIA70086.1 hypothetical protein [Pelagibius litoralis]
MKWLRTLILFDHGDISSSADWHTIHASYKNSIESIDHPLGTGALKLRRKMKDADGKWKRNGVKYLKERFFDHMTRAESWEPEAAVKFEQKRLQPSITLYPSGEEYHPEKASSFGGFDFVTHTDAGVQVAIEWETGNISSSHRSLNKLTIALQNGAIQVGVLIVPSRPLYRHLTDRIGNIDELSGYLRFWAELKATTDRGLLAITVVEHDELTDDPKHQYLPSGLDGRAREGRAKRR